MRVLLKPSLDAFGFGKIRCPDPFGEQRLKVFNLAGMADTSLPRWREDQVNLIPDLTALQNLPLVLVKPRATAVAASVQREGQGSTDFESGHKMAALRANPNPLELGYM